MAEPNATNPGSYYIISAAADRVPCHVQTIRAYVRAGKITPERTIGEGSAAVSLFTDDDITRMRELMNR